MKKTVLLKFKKHFFEDKNFLKKKILKKNCTQKITFWFNLPHKMPKCCVLRAFSKSTILNNELFPKSMILNEEIFVRKTIFRNKNFFQLSSFDIKIFRLVWLWSKIFATCQILDQPFKHASDFESNNFSASDFECTPIVVCQVFMCSSKQGTFRYCFNVWCGFG